MGNNKFCKFFNLFIDVKYLQHDMFSPIRVTVAGQNEENNEGSFSIIP